MAQAVARCADGVNSLDSRILARWMGMGYRRRRSTCPRRRCPAADAARSRPDDNNRLSATPEQQARAVIAAAGTDESVALVAHSGGCVAAYLATDRLSRAIYVDSAPVPDGFVLNPALDRSAPEYPLPEWSDLAGDSNSLDGLDAETLAVFRRRAVAEPTSVATASLQLSARPDRYTIPTTVICCSITAEAVQAFRDTGEQPMFAELDRIDAEYIDLPTGHWPMWSRPHDLADLVHTAANR